MANASELSTAYYAQSRTIARHTARRVGQLWAGINFRDDPGTQFWQGGIGEEAAGAVSLGQYAAARSAGDYVDAVDLTDGMPLSEFDVAPEAFAGRTMFGLDVRGALFQSIVGYQSQVLQGRPPDEAELAAGYRATMLAGNEVANVGREATGAAIAVDNSIVGYRRMLTEPSCDRCIILAGAFYRDNTGFERHPQCDCVHVPVTRAQDNALDNADFETMDASEVGQDNPDTGATLTGPAFDPAGYFQSLSQSVQDSVFGKANAEAIREGADMGRVVNRSSRNVHQREYDRHGNWTGRRLNRTRSTPTKASVTQLLAEANGDKSKLQALLLQNGYIMPRSLALAA